ncbi:hypothetical protein EB796_012787 [Bugula neritina]|uniref:Protein-tyrosine-phosphatase n=1 Tax=Bugula neritina TaxID=10212 RepID=A0A7J7JRD9_BUGNE|nr:hypothetical protein EB796_012787 [Bugula neritina]
MAAMDKIPSTSASQTVCRYSAYTLVECNISAENTAGFGEYIEFNSVYTSCEAPVLHLPANLSSYVKQEESLNLIRIILNTSDVDVTVNCDELTQLVYRVDTETEYTDVGEYIEGLEPGTEYTVEIRAENNAGLGTTQTFDIFTTEKGSAIEEYTTPIKDEVAAGTQSSNPGSCKGGCIGGVVVGVVVVLVVVSILVYRIRTQREHQSKLKNISLDESGYQNMQQINDEEGGTRVVLPQETPRLERVTNTRSIAAIELPEMRDSVLPPQRSIPVSRLADYIENNEAGIIDQFQMLEKLPKPNMSAAQLPENGGKCKYVGLYPEDSTRVILNRPREQGTDFINASYIKGYTSDDMFIAAQGKAAKAVQYWPDQSGSSCVFGDLKVTLTTCECLADYVIRTLNIEKEGNSMSIKQFHYLSWPDHGVPQYISPFLIFVRRVMSVTSHMTGCLVVHCSAGVGRSGTFIALDTLAKQAKDTGEVNPFEVVRAMRRRRPCMVQTKEQYVFTHQALEEYLVTDEFSCEATELETKLADNGDDIYVNRNIISEEFDRIEAQLRRETHNYSIGMEESNINKNRFPDILPSSRHGIYAGGAYINAVVVDSYRKKQSVIATQLPLSNTVKDFWTMVLEQEIKVVVQLEMEEDVFYPSKDTGFVDSDGCIVSRTGSEVEKNVKIIKLTVKSRKVSNVTLSASTTG